MNTLIRKLSAASAVAILMATSGTAVLAAQPGPHFVLQATLKAQDSEVIPTVAEGIGSGWALLDIDLGQNRLCYEVHTKNVSTEDSALHIHAGAAGQNGPIVVPLAPLEENGVSGGCSNVAGATLKAILKHPRQYYINVHNDEHPNGAVRGQLRK